MKVNILVLIILIYSSLVGYTQKINPVGVGEMAPSISIESILNAKSRSIVLNKPDGKIIILDFFATWCSSCVSALVELDEMQRKFGEKLQIIVVSYQDDETIVPFLKRIKALQGLSLAFVTGDTILSRYFPHKTIPHEVWIDQKGIVRAITSAEYITEDNIQSLLAFKEIDLPVKIDFSDFNLKNPLFLFSNNGTIGSESSNYYSGFTGYIVGPSGGMYLKTDSVNGVVRYNQYNGTIFSLYGVAFKNSSFTINPKRCILKVKDSTRFLYNANSGENRDSWSQRNKYCYEAIAPIGSTRDNLRNRLKMDLDFFFGLESKVEKKKVKCLILKPVKVNNNLIKSKDGLNESRLLKNSIGEYKLVNRNNPLSYFTGILNKDNQLYSLPIVIDETGIKGPVDIELKIGKDPTDIDAWRKALNVYGLDLVQEERELEMLMIMDKNFND